MDTFINTTVILIYDLSHRNPNSDFFKKIEKNKIDEGKHFTYT